MATSLALWVFQQAAGGGNGIMMLLPLLLIPVLYFMMIRPQQKRQKQWQEMLSSIKTGDRITTAGGIRGIILFHQGRRDRHQGGAGRHQAGSSQERDCLGDHAGWAFGVVAVKQFSVLSSQFSSAEH